MIKPHLIAVDLDGTLLTEEKVISDRTKMVLQNAMNEGHHVVIATGRPFRSSHSYYKELGLTSPIVNFNGAYVHHPTSSSWGTYHSPIDIKTAHSIFEASDGFTIKNILAEVIDDVYFHYDDPELMDIFSTGSNNISTGNLRETLLHDPTSILIHADEHKVGEIRKHLTDVHAEVIDHRRWGAPWHVIEIVKSGLNKAVGLKLVAEHYQVPRERIIAFGDEDNDLEMIEYAGHGIAMGNAINELKTLSNHVTKTNEEDGIAHYLEEILKLKRN
ncbi:Cof-type HAD-IIB family hydrolase [Bacillus pinisoli]|uniref:Cof-type HAD-IIB family hydrolase n=1 Tax=Bacillus pinisoli TaxID=2901866 RepID=UPI001FF2AEED|nr:Cof-type HAD-IIB family hydrolase [Bacillus pinisoli]